MLRPDVRKSPHSVDSLCLLDNKRLAMNWLDLTLDSTNSSCFVPEELSAPEYRAVRKTGLSEIRLPAKYTNGPHYRGNFLGLQMRSALKTCQSNNTNTQSTQNTCSNMWIFSSPFFRLVTCTRCSLQLTIHAGCNADMTFWRLQSTAITLTLEQMAPFNMQLEPKLK